MRTQKHGRLFRTGVGLCLAFGLTAAPFAAPLALAASPSISYSTTAYTPYSNLTLNGSGFAANETVQLFFGLSATTTQTDSLGTFSNAQLTVPNVPAGLYVIVGIGQTSGSVAFSYIWINNFFPVVSPSGWYVQPGSTITFTGSGFAPNDSLTITGPTGSTTSITANASGTFSSAGSTTVPFSLRNSLATFSVHAGSSGITIPIVISVADLYPYASPSSWYIQPGKSVTFSGGGFGSGEGVSIFATGSTTPLGHATADAGGAFTSTDLVMVPFGTSPANFRVVGDQSGAQANVPITLAGFYPSLNPSAYYAPPGSNLTLSGTGFAPGEPVNLQIGTATSSSTTADSTGAFGPISITLPATPNTMVDITGTGGLSGAVAGFTMAVGAYYLWITLSNYWEQGGMPLTIFGHNFAPNENVLFSSGGSSFASTTADGTGEFTLMTTMPFGPSGALTITALGSVSGSTATSDTTRAPVYTDLQLGSYAGAPGSAAQFLGHGYLPNETLSLTTDRTGSTVVATWTADAGGNFDFSGWNTPSDFVEGNLGLTVTGSNSFDSKTITYYVTGH